MPETRVLRCPICKKAVDATGEDAPFCSERCRTIDLGKWASGAYKISSPILDPDLLEDLEHKQQQMKPVAEIDGEIFWKN